MKACLCISRRAKTCETVIQTRSGNNIRNFYLATVVSSTLSLAPLFLLLNLGSGHTCLLAYTHLPSCSCSCVCGWVSLSRGAAWVQHVQLISTIASLETVMHIRFMANCHVAAHSFNSHRIRFDFCHDDDSWIHLAVGAKLNWSN